MITYQPKLGRDSQWFDNTLDEILCAIAKEEFGAFCGNCRNIGGYSSGRKGSTSKKASEHHDGQSRNERAPERKQWRSGALVRLMEKATVVSP